MRNFLKGGMLALLFINIFIANSTGEAPLYKLNFENCINGSFYLGSRHIHHWLIFFLILICLIPISYFYHKKCFINICLGFSIIMIIHGLKYDDWLVF